MPVGVKMKGGKPSGGLQGVKSYGKGKPAKAGKTKPGTMKNKKGY